MEISRNLGDYHPIENAHLVFVDFVGCLFAPLLAAMVLVWVVSGLE